MNIVERLERQAQQKPKEDLYKNEQTAFKEALQKEYYDQKKKLDPAIREDIKKIASKYPQFQKYALYHIYRTYDFNREIANEFISIQIQVEEQVNDDGWIEVTHKRQYNHPKRASSVPRQRLRETRSQQRSQQKRAVSTKPIKTYNQKKDKENYIQKVIYVPKDSVNNQPQTYVRDSNNKQVQNRTERRGRYQRSRSPYCPYIVKNPTEEKKVIEEKKAIIENSKITIPKHQTPPKVDQKVYEKSPQVITQAQADDYIRKPIVESTPSKIAVELEIEHQLNESPKPLRQQYHQQHHFTGFAPMNIDMGQYSAPAFNSFQTYNLLFSYIQNGQQMQ